MIRIRLQPLVLACLIVAGCGSSSTTGPVAPTNPAQALCDAADQCLDLAVPSRSGIGACIACFDSGVKGGFFAGIGNPATLCGASPSHFNISNGTIRAGCVRKAGGNTAVLLSSFADTEVDTVG